MIDDITIHKITTLTAHEIAFIWGRFRDTRNFSMPWQHPSFITVEQREMMLDRCLEILTKGDK